MYLENKYLKQLKTETKCTARGLRYMDDLLGIVAFKYDHQTNMQASMEKAKDVIKGFKSCYAKDGMKLELEEDTGVNSRRNDHPMAPSQSHIQTE